MTDLTIPGLRVRALQPKRRRAGLEFTSTARELTIEELGHGLVAIMAVAAILADPVLSVTMVDGDGERAVTDDERDALTAFLESQSAADASKVDPASPPTPDAAHDAPVNASAASGDAAADPAPAPAPVDPAPADPAPAADKPAEPDPKPARRQARG